MGTQNGNTYGQAYDSTTGLSVGISWDGIGVADLVSQSYNEYGLVSSLQLYGNNGNPLATESFTYDGNLRPLSTTAGWLANSGKSGTIFSNTRAYDPVGNVTTVSTTHQAADGASGSGGSETQNFCYDEQNRLIWAGNTGTQPSAGNGTCGTATIGNTFTGASYASSYTYTHLGQTWQGPLNGTGSGQQYLYCDSNHPHQLTGVYPSGTTCANRGSATELYSSCYDTWGNQVCRNYDSVSADIYYDALDHVSEWDARTSSQEWYAYDASGQRVAQRTTKGGVTGLTIYAFGLEEHFYDNAGASTGDKYSFHLNGHPVAQFDGYTYRYILTDALGSVLSIFDTIAGSAQLLGNQLYGPYGNKRYQAGWIGTSKGFTGQREDAATGLDYYNARYYDPVVGRFVSSDTMEDNFHGFDPYAYVKSNPETKSDPTGHWEWGVLGLATLGLDVLVTAANPIAGLVLTGSGVANSIAWMWQNQDKMSSMFSSWDGFNQVIDGIGQSFMWGRLGSVIGLFAGGPVSTFVTSLIGGVVANGAISALVSSEQAQQQACVANLHCNPLPTSLCPSDIRACSRDTNPFLWNGKTSPKPTPSWDGTIAPKPVTGKSGIVSQSRNEGIVTSNGSDNALSRGSGGSYYTVRSEDNLWNLANWFYGSGFAWSTIYQSNIGTIGTNPDLIYPGEQLFLPH